METRYCLICFTANPQGGLYCAACQQQAHPVQWQPENQWTDWLTSSPFNPAPAVPEGLRYDPTIPGGFADNYEPERELPRTADDYAPRELSSIPPAELAAAFTDSNGTRYCLVCFTPGAIGLYCVACMAQAKEAVRVDPLDGPGPLPQAHEAPIELAERNVVPLTPYDPTVPLRDWPSYDPFEDERRKTRYCLVCFTEGAVGLLCVACRNAVHEMAYLAELHKLVNETDFSEFADLVQQIDIPKAPKKWYPSFHLPRDDEMDLVSEMTAMLEEQTGLSIDPNQALEAPAVVGAVEGQRNAEHWYMNTDNFWAVFERDCPEAQLLKGGRVVTEEYARHMGWPEWTIGEKLEHHHIYQSRFVVPLPESAHGPAVHPRKRRDHSDHTGPLRWDK